MKKVIEMISIMLMEERDIIRNAAIAAEAIKGLGLPQEQHKLLIAIQQSEKRAERYVDILSAIDLEMGWE